MLEKNVKVVVMAIHQYLYNGRHKSLVILIFTDRSVKKFQVRVLIGNVLLEICRKAQY